MYQTIVQAVLAHAAEQPDKLAVAFKEERLSYRELADRMRRIALILQRDHQVRAGDCVMLSAVSRPDYVAVLLGIQYLGAVSVPIDKAARRENVQDVCDFLTPCLLISDTALPQSATPQLSLKALYAASADETANPCASAPDYLLPDGSALAEILFTTGTTGKPKGAMLTYANLFASTQNTRQGIGIRSDDVELIPLPLNHSVGMRVLRTLLYVGATVVLQNGFTFAKELERNITTFHCTGLVSVPASIEVVYRQMQDRFAPVLGQLRFIEFGAGSLGYAMKRRLLRILPETEIHNTWGSTETGGAIFLDVTHHPDKLTSLGLPAAGVELKVVDPEGRDITATARDINTAGRMALRGPMQMAGYYRSPELTAQTLVDGWLYTNDLVYLDEDGYVYMLGRADDIINVGGEKVSPLEVENIAQEFAEVREAACIGAEDPDGILGRIPVLFVVPESSAYQEKDLVRYLSTRLEKYKMPQRYLQLDELPRNRMKKLDRKALQQIWDEQGTVTGNEVLTAICSRHSVRDFAEREVPRGLLAAAVEAGIHAPSGRNLQTWRFTVLRRPDDLQALRQTTAEAAARCGVGFYGFHNPPAVVLVSNDRRNPDGIQDSACAAENIMLAAHALGLGSVWINALHSLCDEPDVRALLDRFGVPAQHIVWAMVAIGYPAGPVQAPARNKKVIRWVE